jgi:hypothetical protein
VNENGAISRRCDEENGYNEGYRGIDDGDEDCREDADETECNQVTEARGNGRGNVVCIFLRIHAQCVSYENVPGFSEYLRQNNTKVHMKDPKSRLERHAEDIEVQTTMMNLYGTVSRLVTELTK